jgi:hypothetical protein
VVTYTANRNTNRNSRKTNARTKKRKTRKLNQLRLFTLKHEFLKISVHLQTAEAHGAGGATEHMF